VVNFFVHFDGKYRVHRLSPTTYCEKDHPGAHDSVSARGLRDLWFFTMDHGDLRRCRKPFIDSVIRRTQPTTNVFRFCARGHQNAGNVVSSQCVEDAFEKKKDQPGPDRVDG
jgi:hypothetical protein